MTEIQQVGAYKYLEVSGNALERGRQYGTALKDEIQHMLQVEIHGYMKEQKGIEPEEIEAFAEMCLPYIQRDAPLSFDFMRGVSEGSRMALGELAAILAHEEFFHGHTIAHHCTAMAVASVETTDNRTYIGQTWDWLTSMIPHTYLLKQTAEDGMRILTYSFPGLWAGAGMNSEGVSLVWTAAGYGHAAQHGGKARDGVPSYALISEVLQKKTFDEAVAYLEAARHAGWFLFLLAGKGGQITRVEASPSAKAVVKPTSIAAAHGNYLDEDVAKSACQDQPAGHPAHNQRYARTCELLVSHSGRLNEQKMKEILLEEDPKIPDLMISLTCKNEPIGTIDSFLFCPDTGKAWFIPQPSDGGQWQEFTV